MITTENALSRYGYLWDGMHRISKATALKYRSQGYQVYLLYTDNTENAAESIDDILNHARKGGIFGIEKCMVV